MRKNSRAHHLWTALELERKRHLRTKRLLAEAKRRMKLALQKIDEYGPWMSDAQQKALHAVSLVLCTPTDKALKR